VWGAYGFVGSGQPLIMDSFKAGGISSTPPRRGASPALRAAAAVVGRAGTATTKKQGSEQVACACQTVLTGPTAGLLRRVPPCMPCSTRRAPRAGAHGTPPRSRGISVPRMRITSCGSSSRLLLIATTRCPAADRTFPSKLSCSTSETQDAAGCLNPSVCGGHRSGS